MSEFKINDWKKQADIVADVLSRAPAFDKGIRVGIDEFKRRQNAVYQALAAAGFDAGLVYSDEHYHGDVPYLGGNTNISIEPVAGIIGIAVVFGLAMTFVYYMFSSISGAHVNPAVSVAMYFNGAISLVETILYIVAQLLGALLASGLLLGILKCIPSVSITTLGVGQRI